VLGTLAALCPGVVVVKCGAAGSYCADNSELLAVEALPVEVDNAVGAGDVYDAGMIASYLKGGDVLDAMSLGPRRPLCMCPAGRTGSPPLRRVPRWQPGSGGEEPARGSERKNFRRFLGSDWARMSSRPFSFPGDAPPRDPAPHDQNDLTTSERSEPCNPVE
jgi:hypothetical protein